MSIHEHLVSHINHPGLRSDSTLHVVGVISNPVRYHSRYRLFRKWYERMMKTPNVKVYVVEIAYGDRQHECTESNNPQHLQLRTKHALWHKENMINLGVRHMLPRDWKYLAWVDCDVFWPEDFNWALETIQQLQHFPVVQPWKDCADLGFHGDVIQTFQSFGYVHQLGVKKQTHPGEPYKYAHSGFAWACTREFWEAVGGLMDFPILGSADHHMAWAMIGSVQSSVHGKMTDEFKRKANEWQTRAHRIVQGNIGFVKTRIGHWFHGPKAKRYYRERWQIFMDHGFNPDTQLAYDHQGLLYIVGNPNLDREIGKYLTRRCEDSIDEN